MKRKRAMTLMGTLWLTAFLSVLFFGAAATVQSVQQRLIGHKQTQQAMAMAVSGQDYAGLLKRGGKLTPGFRFQSPDFEGGRFVVEVTGAGRVLSTGYSGRSQYRLEGVLSTRN